MTTTDPKKIVTESEIKLSAEKIKETELHFRREFLKTISDAPPEELEKVTASTIFIVPQEIKDAVPELSWVHGSRFTGGKVLFASKEFLDFKDNSEPPKIQ